MPTYISLVFPVIIHYVPNEVQKSYNTIHDLFRNLINSSFLVIDLQASPSLKRDFM